MMVMIFIVWGLLLYDIQWFNICSIKDLHCGIKTDDFINICRNAINQSKKSTT